MQYAPRKIVVTVLKETENAFNNCSILLKKRSFAFKRDKITGKVESKN